MNACYIIFSPRINKFYIGATHEDVQQRLLKHNQGTYGKSRFTAVTNDWELFLIIHANDYPHAIRIERKIKAMKSAKYIRELKSFPEKVDRLVSCT